MRDTRTNRAKKKIKAYDQEIVFSAMCGGLISLVLITTYYYGKSNGSHSYNLRFLTDGTYVTHVDPNEDS